MQAVLIVLVSLAALAVAGCTLTTAGGQSLRAGSNAYSAYVEQVFRAQNRVASQLAFALVDLEDTDSARYRVLTDAEDRLFKACQALNDLAARRRDGQRIGPLRGLHASRSAPDCERATQAAAAVLQR